MSTGRENQLKIYYLISALLLAGCAQAATLTVGPYGCDYTSIQAAINAASPGDVIEAHSGEYSENIYINKSIALYGVGTVKPIISAKDPHASTILIVSRGVTLKGFRVNCENSGIFLEGRLISPNFDSASMNCILEGNEVHCGKDSFGIYLSYSNYNYIANNTIVCDEGGGYGAIALFSSHNNRIQGNTAIGCRSEGDKGGYGIYLEFSENNLIFLNNFDTNPTAYSNYSSNFWNDNMRGNYWVDYIADGGKDENGDGIGDLAYDIPGTNGEQDKFPLMEERLGS
jgi:parallel beta-helix repeat protein